MGYEHVSDIPYAVVEERTFVRRVYAWMTGGLAVTAVVALLTAMTPSLIKAIATNPVLLIGLFIGELVLVGALSMAIARMSPATAGACFVLYSALNGLTLSLIFLIYTASSIASTFFVAAATFGAMSLYGYTTKRDLTSIGHLCMMGVIGMVIAFVVNMIFMRSSGFDLIVSGIGVLVFVGLTAYDTQKIKAIHALGKEGTDADKRAAVLGALALYLDFINLFLLLLRLFGRRR